MPNPDLICMYNTGVNPKPEQQSMSNDNSASAQNGNGRGRKAKVYAEEVKNRHTTHWDLDYMSPEEVEDAYRDQLGQTPNRSREAE